MVTMNEKLRQIQALFVDADGVYFDGQEMRSVVGGAVVIGKQRSLQDGQGVSFLRELGLTIVFVSGDGDPLSSIVEKINGLPSAKSGRWKPVVFAPEGASKADRITAWSSESGVPLSSCAYFGDDVDDLSAMQRIKDAGGVSIAPQNATRRIREVVDTVTNARGGSGALREFADMLIDAYNRDEREFPPA